MFQLPTFDFGKSLPLGKITKTLFNGVKIYYFK